MEQNQGENTSNINYNMAEVPIKNNPVFSSLSLVIAFFTFFFVVLKPVVGLVFCALILVLNIVSLVRKERFMALSIIGLVLTVIFFVLGNLMILVDLDDNKSDIFAERKFTMGDESSLYLNGDGTYIWYQDDTNKEDNYYSGTYKVYQGKEAEEYMNSQYKENDYESDELVINRFDEFYDRNRDNPFYSRKNFYYLVMYCDYRLVNGEVVSEDEETIPYFGFADGEKYDLANTLTGNYMSITDIEIIE